MTRRIARFLCDSWVSCRQCDVTEWLLFFLIWHHCYWHELNYWRSNQPCQQLMWLRLASGLSYSRLPTWPTTCHLITGHSTVGRDPQCWPDPKFVRHDCWYRYYTVYIRRPVESGPAPNFFVKPPPRRDYTPCPTNETRVILNILYSCKSIAMKFSTWYPDGLNY